MSKDLYTRLSWLPPPPVDFASRCRRVNGETAEPGQVFAALASFALNENQLNELARAMARARSAGLSLAPLTPFRLAILTNGTMNLIVPALIASAARHGIALECAVAEYGQAVQAALEPAGALERADAVLIAIDHRGFQTECEAGEAERARELTERSLAQLDAMRNGLKRQRERTCILQTIAPPPERLFGGLDAALPGSALSLVRALNCGMAERASGSADILFDVAGLAETVGLAHWHSPVQWNLAKLPFSDVFVPLYSEHLGRLVGALCGKSRRCLVLDLDNTVWGGAVGDDGLPGIACSEGDPTGEAHLAVQRLALALRKRGVVLAVSSKNSDAIARAPFREHPDMLLREEHIAVFQANWEDKATNLAAIADELSLGLGSLVLLDDHPAERAFVRGRLPEVAVPELPADPALYARTLAAAGYFEATMLSAEDHGRARAYQDNARRIQLKQESADLSAYLASLQMEIAFEPFNRLGRARIAQLIAKSNQFNLTTKRYSEAEIEAIASDRNALTLQVRLQDMFGDNGMISVVICRPTAEGERGEYLTDSYDNGSNPRNERVWEIDTWLMSCRVQGRQVENAVLREIIRQARARGIGQLLGIYRPTERNRVVADHYPKLGFVEGGRSEDGTSWWRLDVRTARLPEAPMVVRRPTREEREPDRQRLTPRAVSAG